MPAALAFQEPSKTLDVFGLWGIPTATHDSLDTRRAIRAAPLAQDRSHRTGWLERRGPLFLRLSPMTSSHRHGLAIGLAHALLADHERPGGLTASALLGRASACLGCEGAAPSWLRRLTQSIATRWQRHGAIDTLDTLAQALLDLPDWGALFHDDDDAEGDDTPAVNPDEDKRPLSAWRVRRWLLRPARTVPPVWGLPAIDRPDWPSASDWADGLGLTPERLAWLTHPSLHWRESSERPHQRVASHYRHALLPKRSGGLRLLEAPKPELKQAQRRLLDTCLTQLPCHEAAHGFVRGRDVHSHAAVHAGQPCVIAFDLRDFFPSIGAARIRALWRSLGYPEPTADLLTRLCTTRTPAAVRERLREDGGLHFLAAKRLARPHLPQGAPTSPALANLCAFGLDLRLDGLAHRFGARYSRYADDLVFSGPLSLQQQFRSLQAWVKAIAADEGFVLHPGKQRQMRAHQQQRITGLVVNQHANLPREDYDRLRAELHQAARSGPVDASEQARLQGRVAWASQHLAPTRITKLKALLARVEARA